MESKKILAIIPARGGSKRIPRKNIKNFLGKPIISYSIKAALESKLFDEVMVSTDDLEISKIAIKYGAEVPFLRSSKNSSDYSTISNVIREVIKEYQTRGKVYEYFYCIYPTAPLISAKRLIESYRLIKKLKADALVPVTRYSYPIQRSLNINKSGYLVMNWPENAKIRSQDLKLNYHDAGLFFCARTKNYLLSKKTFIKNTAPLVIPESEVQDIDTKEDWKLAEVKYQILKN